MSLFNQFTPAEAREIHKFDHLYFIPSIFRADQFHSSKVLLPLVCYVFQDGPWRDTLVRFSYDPRKDPKARL
jgi:general transcription factor 3C polypeptide 5 (transcription factor C subunit 1)